MRRALPALAIVLVAAAVPAGRAGAQAVGGPVADSLRLEQRRALWQSMTELERLEIGAARVRPASHSATRLAVDRRHAQDALVAALDRAVGEAWGPEELEQLRLAFPGSRLLEVYAAHLAERQGDPAAALATVEALLRTAPADGDLQRTRGRLLERLGRTAEAADAYARALDLDPENDSTFRARQRLAEAQGRLEEVLAQIRRLRIRLPGSRVLADHETEVLERMGGGPEPRPGTPATGRGRP